ncbi:SDR family NAD(P)-dependent oxidoreductase [Streptomyces ipomoeae]|uniref:SDR family NAD(P)-dependent oxidoreductase n=1 Tax=Streptomyces ipomoeae TaxID=103232 RepID=UPI0011478D88|nr:SDR family NAD(P)-dependent oxidoreductase [Streptomyces ipomoeae]MDX2938548.1 SDR family NAD(P)-dependent oxidoreductase [Streptomyces ipomoeae]TQE20160.1 SDR family oxidoreductase [Streptomyces ipomoeae]
MTVQHTPRTALVTGAGSRRGIGRATAHALAADGHHLAVLDLDKEAAEETAREVAARHGVRTLALAADVTDADAVDAAITQAEAALPPIGALVNNAGITSPIPFLDVTPGEWDRIFDVNVRGSFLVTQRVAAGMAERGFGRIVFLSSVSAERGGGVFGGVAYSAAKAALLGFARALARELGPSGVTANCVAPGLIDTDITQGKLDEARKTAMTADIPMRRIGGVEDVADVIAFLARPGSGYVTGATYDVNGGSHIH